MAKIQIKPKFTLHFKLGDAKTGKPCILNAGEVATVDENDIKNIDKKDYEVVTGKEADAPKK